MAVEHLLNVAFNRTTLAPTDRKYDLGLAGNVRQVFGDSALLWPLPTVPRGMSTDGYSWPLNPKYRVGGVAPRRKRAGPVSI